MAEASNPRIVRIAAPDDTLIQALAAQRRPAEGWRFAPLDGDFARAIIERHPAIRDIDSVVFVDEPGQPGERVAVRSEAALRVVDYLGGPWKLLNIVRVIPAVLRDRLYDGFARIRYRVFGKYDSCPIPPPDVRLRFVDG